jgi:glycosyltransferase involved in cell wall biosynthesis
MTDQIKAKPSLTVVLLTFNEERHLARALESIAEITDAIVIVDSGSTDDTLSIAATYGARTEYRAFVNQADQFQWALDHCGIDTDWVMRLDADEVIEPDLAEKLCATLPTLDINVTGINLLRKHIFMGRFIRHGGRYPLVMLRVWRRGKARIEQRWMDEHMMIDRGRTITLRGGFADINLNDLTFFTAKHNAYATREAIEVLSSRYGLRADDHGLSAKTASRQASLKRSIKERIYNHLPLGVGPLGYFLWRYLIQLGILDGGPGLIYHFLQGFWYRFLVDAKVREYEQKLIGVSDNVERRRRLSAMTGYRLDA